MVCSCHACVNLSCLRSSGFTLTLRSGSSPSSMQQWAGHIACTKLPVGLPEIFKCTHLKFMVYGRKQTYIDTYIHKTSANAVTLVWGSLRLAPNINLYRVALQQRATHHRMFVTHCLAFSLLDLCASENVHPSMYSSLSSCPIFLSGEPLCLTVHFICTVFCATQNVVSKSDPQKIEKESL